MYQPLISNVSTATAVVFTGKGFLNQLIVNSHSSGVISIGNGTSSIINLVHSSIALAAGERYIPFNGEVFEDGCFINTSGTLNVTFQYRKNA